MKTRDFTKVLELKLAKNPELALRVEREYLNACIASDVYNARKKRGLTQKELAELVGTQQSVISRIEDSDYEGHSLSSLLKVAQALGLKLKIAFEEPSTNDESEFDFLTSTNFSLIGSERKFESYPSAISDDILSTNPKSNLSQTELVS